MDNKAFFYAVANMRECQKAYIRNRNPQLLRATIMAEKEVDVEIQRVRNIINKQNNQL